MPLKTVVSKLNFLLFSILLLSSCNQKNKLSMVAGSEASDIAYDHEMPIGSKADTTFTNYASINDLFEDSRGNMWIGTDYDGVCIYNHSLYSSFSTADGLPSKKIKNFQEDKNGRMWIQTDAGLCMFDGATFTPIPSEENNSKQDPLFIPSKVSKSVWQLSQEDLWFTTREEGHVLRFDGKKINRLTIPKPKEDSLSSKYTYNPYNVYKTYKDRENNIWFGTLAGGVLMYDGNSFRTVYESKFEFVVISIFQDSHDNMWFGTNGGGVYRYNEKGLSNLTEEHGLQNEDFLRTKKVAFKEGTLARIFDIEEDKNGNIWFATIDSGVWKFDGEQLINYNKANGLPSKGIRSILKDKNGKLWFGSANGCLSSFNGTSFDVVNPYDEKMQDGC